MNSCVLKICVLSLLLLFIPGAAPCGILTTDTVWSGDIIISDNVTVPEGITLTLQSGSKVYIEPSEMTGQGPALPGITVRGRIRIEGNRSSPVVIHVKGEDSPGLWEGITIEGGSAFVRWTALQNAVTGFNILNGRLDIGESVIRKNQYGIAAYRGAFVRVKNTKISGNHIGVVEVRGSEVKYSGVSIDGNRKKDLYSYGKKAYRRGIKKFREISSFSRSDASCRDIYQDLQRDYSLPEKKLTRIYAGEVLGNDTIWEGRIQVEGLVRLDRDARLVIMPGTIVEFRKEDSDGDGTGENGLLIHGVLIAKGTKKAPIIFRSGERERSMGDWDSIIIMHSNGVLNLLEYVQVEDSYGGLHFIDSNVIVNQAVLKKNYRAVRFQKSRVELRGNYLFENMSGIEAGESEVLLSGNYVFNNINGMDFFRTTLNAKNNKILKNSNRGFRVTAGTAVVTKNIIECNRFGLVIDASDNGRFSGNFIAGNFETGVSVRDSDNIDLSGNFIQKSGLNGINLISVSGTVRGNNISENGEMGIAIRTFAGTIAENAIAGNGLYAVENQGSQDILAPLNWWGERRADRVIYDKFDDKKKGMIIFSPAVRSSVPYPWDFGTIKKDITWYGTIAVDEHLDVIGATLKIAPGTRVVFSSRAGLHISGGRIIAKGREYRRIRFLSASGDPEEKWDEIFLDRAPGSLFAYCDFENALWAVHSEFTDLKVSNSVFTGNLGAMNIRGGYTAVSESIFTENEIALQTFTANAVIRDNVIFNNNIGFYVMAKGRGLKIRNNNIHANRSCNIQSGDYNFQDIDARGNWWGSDDPAMTLCDGRRVPGLGMVIYEPYLVEEIPFGEEEDEAGGQKSDRKNN